MSMIPTAIVGVGQTHHKSRRRDVSIGGLVREAVFRALEDAHMTLADIDAVILGKAPDLFEGVMKPELYLSDALGAVGKPMFRVHTAGSVGGTTAIVAASHVQAGKHRTGAGLPPSQCRASAAIAPIATRATPNVLAVGQKNITPEHAFATRRASACRFRRTLPSRAVDAGPGPRTDRPDPSGTPNSEMANG